jgi:hypothetical protein
MTSKNFIKDKLTQIWNCFPEVQFRYEFKIHTNTHVIEVIPFSVFEGNEEYMRTESDFEYEFEQMFPEEDILFISEGSLTQIKNVEYQLGPKNLNFKNEVSEFNYTFIDIEKPIDNTSNFALAA